MSRAEMDQLGWDSCDIIIVTGDAYVDHPSFGMAVIGRVLEGQGFRVGIISQPDWRSAEAFRALGKPNLFLPIVVMAGHADSQGTASPGTPGYAVDQQKRAPMQPGIRDELFWNREVQAAVVTQGQARGLNIRAYTPPSISIANDDDPSTNWSKAKVFSERGEYVLEIHFDAYRPHGFGSGLIPVLPNVRELNVVDESLAQAFGRYPRLFRGGLGGPRRGIGILEIAMLEPPLETKLRNPRSREHTVNCLAERVVNALVQGVS